MIEQMCISSSNWKIRNRKSSLKIYNILIGNLLEMHQNFVWVTGTHFHDKVVQYLNE